MKVNDARAFVLAAVHRASLDELRSPATEDFYTAEQLLSLLIARHKLSPAVVDYLASANRLARASIEASVQGELNSREDDLHRRRTARHRTRTPHRDPDEHHRGTVIVKLAAKKTRGAREMLLLDRDHVWRDRAIAHLHRTAAEAAAKHLSDAEVNDAIATMIAYQATDSLAKSARRRR